MAPPTNPPTNPDSQTVQFRSRTVSSSNSVNTRPSAFAPSANSSNAPQNSVSSRLMTPEQIAQRNAARENCKTCSGSKANLAMILQRQEQARKEAENKK